MPRKAKELTSTEVRRLTKRPGLHPVGGVSGLLLQVTASGATSWILRYTTGEMRRSSTGKPYAVRHDMGLGPFPEVTLAQAREDARKIKRKIREGIDPVAERKAAKDATRAAKAKRRTFEQVARECHAVKARDFRSEKHRADWINSLEMHAFPDLGSIPVGDIELPHVKTTLDRIWTTKTETAMRVRGRIESALTFATVSGYRRGENPARWEGNLKEVMPNPSKGRKVRHHRALPWQEVPEFMKALRKREGMGARALEFIIYTAARSGEVRAAKWDQIDLSARVWTIPAERMKAGKAHRVPLSDDAMALLESLPRFEGCDYVLPSTRGRMLSDMSISAVCKRMEVDATPHGFRSSFKDWARARTSYADEVSELALAHVNSDATRAAYARDELLPRRARLMADWARFLNQPTTTGEVVPIREHEA